MNRIIAIAPSNKRLWNNRAVDRDYLLQTSDGSGGIELLDLGARRGYRFMTADVFLREKPQEKAFLISEQGFYGWRPRKGLIPAVCFCLESPIVAWYFYLSLGWIGNRFRSVFLWPGALGKLNRDRVNCNPIFWPNQHRYTNNTVRWREKKFLTLVNSNKAAFEFSGNSFDRSRPFRSSVKSGISVCGLIGQKFCPWMQSNLYLERLEAIRFFSKTEDFDLYGQGWDKPTSGNEKLMRRHIERSWRGSIAGGTEAKLNVLKNYKFCLCFENTSFPGYITEKIFDCFFAGCIPIYLGAPDISEYIPPESFIDARAFNSHSDISDFIASIDEPTANTFLEAAGDFVNSPRFERFHVSYFNEQIIAAVERVDRETN